MVILDSLSSMATTIAVIAFGVLLVILIAINILFVILPKLQEYNARRSAEKAIKAADSQQSAEGADDDISAVISLALHLSMDDAGERDGSVITIKRVSRNYSPWNSKIYGLNNFYYGKN